MLPNNQDSNSYRSRLIQETDRLMKQLNFTVKEGRAYLSQHYQKISRHQLTDQQLTEFYNYLQQKSQVSQQKQANIQITETQFNQLLEQINQLMKQLNWTTEDGQNYLVTHYRKKSRILLSDAEILEFRDMLQQKVSETVRS